MFSKGGLLNLEEHSSLDRSALQRVGAQRNLTIIEEAVSGEVVVFVCEVNDLLAENIFDNLQIVFGEVDGA